MMNGEILKKKIEDDSSSIHEVITRPIPDDLAELMIEYKACIKARDDMVNKRILGYKKAKRFAIDAERARSKFWNKVYQLYPDAHNKHDIMYYHDEQVVKYKKVV